MYVSWASSMKLLWKKTCPELILIQFNFYSPESYLLLSLMDLNCLFINQGYSAHIFAFHSANGLCCGCFVLISFPLNFFGIRDWLFFHFTVSKINYRVQGNVLISQEPFSPVSWLTLYLFYSKILDKIHISWFDKNLY